MLTLEDLKDYTQDQVIQHLIENYSGDQSGFDYGSITEADKQIAADKLKNLDVVLAYESVGDYGCDSQGFFILKNHVTNDFFEIHGGHCSCYGFEGQLDLELTTLQALQKRAGEGKLFYCGGYDNNESQNTADACKYILSLS